MNDDTTHIAPPRMRIGVVSRATGIPVSTLRTWERRYGFPVPARAASGQRSYGAETIERLQLVKRALDAGHRARVVVPLESAALRALLGDAAHDDVPAGGNDATIERLIQWGHALETDRLRHELATLASRQSPLDFLTSYVAPLMVRVGEAWASGAIGVVHEHAISEQVMGILRDLWHPTPVPQTARSIVLATLPDEHHAIGLHMAAVVLVENGWRVAFLGANTPVIDIVGAAQQLNASAVGVSVTRAYDLTDATRELRSLRRALAADIALVTGGSGAPSGLEGVTTVDDVASLAQWAKQTRPASDS